MDTVTLAYFLRLYPCAAPWAATLSCALWLTAPPAPADTPAVPAPAMLTVVAGANVTVEGTATAHRDFGSVDPLLTPRLEVQFTLRNNFTTPVTITRLQSSCGCTSALLGNGPPQGGLLAPNKQANVQVSIDLTRLRGSIYKSVLVYLDGSTSPAATLIVTARLQDIVLLSPSVLDFGRVSAGAPHVRTLAVTLDQRLLAGRTLRLTSSTPDVVVSPPDASIPAGPGQSIVQTYMVTLSPHARLGRLFGSLSFTAAPAPAAQLAAVSVPLVAEVVGKVTAMPDSVVFGQVPAGEAATREIALSVTSPSTLRGARLASAGPWVSAHLRTRESHGAAGAWLEVTLSPRTPPGGLNTQISVTTGDGETLVLPVLATVTPKATR